MTTMSVYYPNLGEVWRVIRDTDFFTSADPDRQARIETALRVQMAVFGESTPPATASSLCTLLNRCGEEEIRLPDGPHGPGRSVRLDSPESRRELFTATREAYAALQSVIHPDDPTRRTLMLPPDRNPLYLAPDYGEDSGANPSPESDASGSRKHFLDVPPERLAYKFIAPVPNQQKVSQGFVYPVPGADGPSEWFEADAGALKHGRRGIHTLRIGDVLRFMVGWHSACHCDLWAMEGDGEYVERDQVIVWRRARILYKVWSDRTRRLFAADLAEMALPVFERHAPDDIRPWAAIDAVREFAHGRITEEELRGANQSAFLASFAPRGESGQRGSDLKVDRRAARMAALAAERASGEVPPGYTTTVIINAVVAAGLDAGVPWEPMIARSLDYIREGERADEVARQSVSMGRREVTDRCQQIPTTGLGQQGRSR